MIQRSGAFPMPEMDFKRIPEAMQEGLQSTREMIEEYPASAVFAAFGLGLGVGVGVALLMGAGSMFTPPAPQRRYW